MQANTSWDGCTRELLLKASKTELSLVVVITRSVLTPERATTEFYCDNGLYECEVVGVI